MVTAEPAAEVVAEPAAEVVAEPAAEVVAEPAAAESAATKKRADPRSAIEWPANDRLAPPKPPKKPGGTAAGDLEVLRRALLADPPPEAPELEATTTPAESSATPGAIADVAADIATPPPSKVGAPAASAPEAPAAVAALQAATTAAAAQPETDDWDLSEANAEREALREAVAIVMDEDDGPDAPTGQPDRVEAAATETRSTEPETPPAEVPADAKAPPHAPAAQDSVPKKKGLFRRIRG
jgi:ribonuclease E